MPVINKILPIQCACKKSCRGTLVTQSDDRKLFVVLSHQGETLDVMLDPKGAARLRDAISEFLKGIPEREWNQDQLFPEVCSMCRGRGHVLALNTKTEVRSLLICGKCGGDGKTPNG